MTRCGLLAIFSQISFAIGVDLDAPVTARTWNGIELANYNALLQYVPAADQETDEYDLSPVEFTFVIIQEL